MRFRCLILDHDDTVVNSTATVHYPSFVEYMKAYKPGVMFSLEDYFRYNFAPGVVPFFRDIVGLDEKEMEEEEQFWKEYAEQHVPLAYPGIRELLEEHRAGGGIIAVASHSYSHNILRDYRENGLPEPDQIYGWDLPASLRKPDPYAVFEVLKTCSLAPSDVLVVDDLKPGYDMARAAGVTFAAAGWANDIPEIESFMRQNSDYYFKTVQEFTEFLRG